MSGSYYVKQTRTKTEMNLPHQLRKRKGYELLGKNIVNRLIEKHKNGVSEVTIRLYSHKKEEGNNKYLGHVIQSHIIKKIGIADRLPDCKIFIDIISD